MEIFFGEQQNKYMALPFTPTKIPFKRPMLKAAEEPTKPLISKILPDILERGRRFLLPSIVERTYDRYQEKTRKTADKLIEQGKGELKALPTPLVYSLRGQAMREVIGEESIFMGLTAPIKKAVTKKIVTPTKSLVKNLIKTRYSEIKIGSLESEIFIRDIKKNLTKKEREIIPFLIQGTYKTPEKLKPWVKKIRDYYDEGFLFLRDNYQKPNYLQNYVNQVWDIPKNRTKEAISFFTTKNPFTKQRKIPTLEEGIKLGLKPKTTDITKLIRIYDGYKATTVANKRFVDGLNKLSDEFGNKFIIRADKAPADWVSVQHPALDKAIGVPIGEGQLLIPKIPSKVHPEIAKQVKVVLGQPFSGAAVHALDTIYAFTKKTALSVSLFHHYALTESAISAGIYKKLISLWSPKNIYNAIKKGNYAIFKDIPLTKDALKHQLQLGALPDIQRSRVHQTLKNLEFKTKNVPILKSVTKGIRSFNEIWDKFLWDYYHNSLKLYAYENWVEQALKKNVKKGFPQTVNQIKDKAAILTNNTFGGQIWENLMVTPKMQQVLHWTLLSPDWTLSTLKQAGAPFKSGLIGKEARKFWLRAAIYFYGVSNVLNYANTKKEFGEGKWMWENDPEHKTFIFLGMDENGQKKYLRHGKQFREIFEWLENPLKKFGNKLAPVTREALTQLSGTTPIGWDTEFKGKDFWDIETLKARAKSLISLGAPYSLSTVTKSKNLLGLAFPISKGLSWYEANELMIKAIEKKDKNYLTEIWRAALENNLNAQQIYENAKREVTIKNRLEFQEVRDLVKKLREMERKKGEKILKDLPQSQQEQIRKFLENEADIQRQKKKLP